MRSKAWRSAEQNSPDEAVRARMEKKWRGMESNRLDFETAEKKRTVPMMSARRSTS